MAHKADAGGRGPHTWGRSRVPGRAGGPTPPLRARTAGDRHLRTGPFAGPSPRTAIAAQPFQASEARRARRQGGAGHLRSAAGAETGTRADREPRRGARPSRGTHLDLKRHEADLATLAHREALGQVHVLAPLLGEELHHEFAVHVDLVAVQAEELLDEQLVARAVRHGGGPREDREAEEHGHRARRRPRPRPAPRPGRWAWPARSGCGRWNQYAPGSECFSSGSPVLPELFVAVSRQRGPEEPASPFRDRDRRKGKEVRTQRCFISNSNVAYSLPAKRPAQLVVFLACLWGH